MKAKISWVAIMAFCFFPVLPWLALRPISSRFSDIWTTATSLGQLSGLIGMAMFGLTLILSARTKWLDKFLQGLNLAYIKHHQLGAISFVLLLFHPLFLAVKYGQTSWQSAAQFLIPSDLGSPVGYGAVALILMILLLAITFYSKLPYQIWKLSHKFLAVAYFFATLHLIFIYSDTSQSLLLKGYMLLVSLLALAAGFYRTVGGKRMAPTARYQVKAVKPMNGNFFEITMDPEKEPIAYEPGQFIFISFEQDGFKEEHPFSLSSAGHPLSITIKNLGDYTSRLGELKVGTTAIIQGPYGRFSYRNAASKKQVWLAGGVGITPFLSMARSLGETSDYQIDLFYCTNTASDAIFMNELSGLAATRSWFRVFGFYADEQGRITAEAIAKSVGDLSGRDYFLCGPPPMMRSIKEQLKKSNIPEASIHSEEFAML